MAVASPERETITARARYVRTSARKARLVLEHIRGKPAPEARSILAFQTRAVAEDAGKVLASAIANAENNAGHDPDDLVVVAASADEGPTLKRWRPRARGRVNRIRKRTCHITIELAVVESVDGARRARPERAARPSRRALAQPEQPEAAEPEAAEPEAPEAAEPEAPAGLDEAPAAEEAPAEEPAAEEPKPARKPRARRTTKKVEEAAAEATEEAANEPAEEAAKPSRRRRTTAKKKDDGGENAEEAKS
jgi:large subunit ribosomal protein L22